MSIRGRKSELAAGNALGCARLLRDRLRVLCLRAAKTSFIQESQAEGEILPTKVRSEDNRSNILSKIIRESSVFKRERDLLLNVKNHVRPS